ncbi:hypothetical protein BH09BAC1_BH09BAC1_30980 [soil metagenome]
MRKLLLVLIIVMTGLTAFAQNKFNGTVNFNIEYKGDNVGMFASMLPNKQVYSYSEGNFKLEMTGGMASGQANVLHQAKEGKTYIVNTSAKKAQEMEPSKTEKNTKVSITETGEKADILGYACDKYKVEIQTDKGSITQYIYATKALQPVVPKNVANLEGMAAFTDKIKGLPLKIEMQLNQGGINISMIMTATSIKEGDPGNIFTIPADYTVEPFDAKTLGR